MGDRVLRNGHGGGGFAVGRAMKDSHQLADQCGARQPAVDGIKINKLTLIN